MSMSMGMKKCVAVLLLLAMLAAAACTGETPPPADPDTTPAQTTDTTAPEPESTAAPASSLPEDLSFGGETVTMLVWSDVENPEFKVEAITGEVVNDALYQRNRTVEERLGVKLDFIETPGNFGNQAAFLSTAQNHIFSGAPLDIMAAYSLTATSLVSNNLTMNLGGLRYLDFDNPWWPKELVNEATVRGNIYFCSGDLSTNMLHKMHAVFFNKTLCRNNGIDPDALYREALDGDWTLDRMMTLTKDIYADVNNDGKRDNNDTYGMVICDNYFDVFFYGSGLRTVDRDAEGTPVLSETFGSEKAAALVEKLGGYFANNDGAHFVTDFTEARHMMNGGTMMIVSRCDVAYKFLRTVDGLDYGILPVPKYDDQQEEYISCLAFPCTLYTVAKTTADPDRAGAVLECMGQEGYRTVTPALFETTMKVKYATDESTSAVYDIIRSTVSFDLGRMFAGALNNLTYTLFRTACSSNSSTYVSQYNASRGVMEKLLSKLVQQIQ